VSAISDRDARWHCFGQPAQVEMTRQPCGHCGEALCRIESARIAGFPDAVHLVDAMPIEAHSHSGLVELSFRIHDDARCAQRATPAGDTPSAAAAAARREANTEEGRTEAWTRSASA
jgi:hypothetical protein